MPSFWCHDCSREFESHEETCEACVHCNSEFLELIEQDNHPRHFAQPAPVDNPLFALLHLLNPQPSQDPQSPRDQRQTPYPAEHQSNMAGDRSASPIIFSFSASSRPHPSASTTNTGAQENMLQGIIQLLQNSMNIPNNDQDGQQHPLMGLMGMLNGGGQMGDYVFGERGLDDIVTRLMEQAQNQNAPPPASEATINGLQRVSVQQTEGEKKLDCSICQDVFNDGEVVIELPNCHHLFHPTCGETWLKINGTCPTCRAKVE